MEEEESTSDDKVREGDNEQEEEETVTLTGMEVGGFQRLVEVCLSSNIGKLFCSSELEVNALPSAADNLKSSSSTKRNQKEGAKLKK